MQPTVTFCFLKSAVLMCFGIALKSILLHRTVEQIGTVPALLAL